MKNDPYKTPDADLAIDKVQKPKTIWWKVFFFLSALIMILAVGGLFVMEETVFSYVEWLDLATTAINFVGLFGLAFNVAIGRQSFWKYFFYFNLIATLIYLIIFPLAGIEMYGLVTELDISYAIGIVFGFLFVWAPYLYGFKRPQIWNRT
ncbi:MAG: hypothetical protein OEY09_10675 [Gammaproteobacteria bacterium]|nr:hypothetical protein [Gammaproteobacteria bacterium]